MTAHWEHFDHAADIGVRGYGATIAEAFAQVALAMSNVITDTGNIRANQCLEIKCKAPDDELLLVDWLNELVYFMATRKMLFATFNVQISGHHLSAKVCGEATDASRHQPAVEIKGATLTAVKVFRGADKQWIAQCVVDV